MGAIARVTDPGRVTSKNVGWNSIQPQLPRASVHNQGHAERHRLRRQDPRAPCVRHGDALPLGQARQQAEDDPEPDLRTREESVYVRRDLQDDASAAEKDSAARPQPSGTFLAGWSSGGLGCVWRWQESCEPADQSLPHRADTYGTRYALRKAG